MQPPMISPPFSSETAAALLQARLHRPNPGRWDIHTTLRHFALINYALDPEKLRPYIPADRFIIPTFPIAGQQLALMSVVPFIDEDFRFVRLAPQIPFTFAQTNYRVYIIDRQTGEHGVWFFGTTLGSATVYIARTLWRIPWYKARYQMAIEYDHDQKKYTHYQIITRSSWAAATIDIIDTGVPVSLTAGFNHKHTQTLLLTHPVTGYYHRLDGRLGGYSVWHEVMEITHGAARQLSFSLLANLGLLTAAEMQSPHSIFICPAIHFDIHLPPRIYPTTKESL